MLVFLLLAMLQEPQSFPAPLVAPLALQRPIAHARWVDSRKLVFDGDPSDWTAGREPDALLAKPEQLVNLGAPPAELWSGERDASARLWLGWNDTDLVIGGIVLDESADYDAKNWWSGDSLELHLGFSPPTPEWKSDDFQLMLAPDWPERPWGVYPHAKPGEVPSDGGFGGVEVSSWPFEGGYRFEARIPWRNFRPQAPLAGDTLSFNAAQTDRDGRGRQESYLTWTGERDIAVWADRRGSLVLDAPAADAGSPASTENVQYRLPLPSLMLVLLVAMYGLALATRRMWRVPRARRRGLSAALVLLALSVAAVLAARYQTRQEAQQRSSDLSGYWGSFESLLRSGALGNPEPDVLQREAQALLTGKAISPRPQSIATHLAPEGATLLPERLTAQRALPFRPIVPEGRAPNDSEEGVLLEPGESLELKLSAAAGVDALALVLRVSDRAYNKAGTQAVPVLAIDLLHGEEAVGPPREVRHRNDLHLDEEEHREHPGLEPAFHVRGGPRGELHADGLFLDLPARSEVDRVRIRHVGSEPSYAVRVVAAAIFTREARAGLPRGLRTTASGEWEWSDWRAGVEAEITASGRAPKKPSPEAFERELRLGSDAVASVWLTDTTPAKNPARWDFLPIAVAAALAPFLVAILAEWISGGRRIRGKLALGFAITSAVPLLVLTLLLEASLGQEHEGYEKERVESLLTRAQIDLEREQKELEQEAKRLLAIAQLVSRAEGRFPQSEELSSPLWWGEGEPGVVRLFEHIEPDGRRVRIGSGPGWRQVPKTFSPAVSGLARPWGKLVVCGVAQTASGADKPMLVIVARAARLAAISTSGLRLVGADRDPTPALSELEPSSQREVRRALFAADGTLSAVLVAERRERGVPLFGDYSLNELLLAAGLTALFTATLFAGILTGHIVAPIERLDRAVREGRTDSLPSEVEVQDEVGHLTGAVQSFAALLEHRVRQLEVLRTAQENLSGHLDAELAREAVLEFFQTHTRAQHLWLVWAGETGEEERLFSHGARNLAVPEGSALLTAALTSIDVIDLSAPAQLATLGDADRGLLGNPERVLSLPLLAGGDCRGAIVVALADRSAALDLAFLRTAASQAAIVLENARLYHQAVTDSVTGFLSDPGFKQRFSEEIQRCEGREDAGVLVVQVRIGGLPDDDARAHARLREAARRMRLAVRGLAVFGRSGSADLRVAIPWSGQRPDFAAIEERVVERVRLGAWPDGELVGELSSAHGAWPDDGASGRLVLHLVDERASQRTTLLPALAPASFVESLPVDFVARSPLMLELLDTLRRVAEREVTLLVAGETGVGKDRIAKLVHEWSPRREGPLVHVHCPSLSTTLIEDELFGHEIGAFTGASSRRRGPFEFARGGTVVLDEIAGLPPEGQVALLRLLETREVLPLGATKPVPLDVRIVATTSADLSVEVERGRFRSDLYFRLNVAQVSVPPLRLRRQDLGELVEAYLRRHNASAVRPVTGVAPAVLDLFCDYSWPGNLRELENILARGFILAAGSELSLEHVEMDPEPVAGVSGGGPLNERQAYVLESLAIAARISSTEYAEHHGISSRTGLRDLLDLVEMGYLKREGTKRGTRFRRTGKAWAAVHGQ